VTNLVLMELPLSVTAQTTVEDLIRASTPDLSDGQDVVRQAGWSPEHNDMVFIEMTPEQAAMPRDITQAMQRLAGCLQPGPPVKLEWPDDEDARPAVARADAEVAELARRTGYPVYSDDRFFRAMLAQTGLTSFGTVALLMALRQSGVIDDTEREKTLETLSARGPLGLPSTPSA
jgi:hypothetical protein